MKARDIIRDCLTFRLNQLSPGEPEDADLFNTCLRGLNNLVDKWNGVKSFLFREIRTAGTVTGVSGTLGSTWSLSPGDSILGASYNNGSIDIELGRLTMAQYQAIPVKTQTGDPIYWAYDGASTIYFWPVPSSRSVTLRTKEAVSSFADLDTVYTVPAGYQSALVDELAELLAPNLAKGLLTKAEKNASAARSRIQSQAYVPAILDGVDGDDYDIYRGF
jgi:hypothetical protein